VKPPIHIGGWGLWMGSGAILTWLRSKNVFLRVTVSPSRRRRTIPRASLVRSPRSSAFELFYFVANADTEFEPSARNDIHHGDILGKAHGIVKRH
jgi:hypothetical protein